MTDWKRAERHYRLNRIAECASIVSIILLADEVLLVFKYHFPWWDDVAIPLTAGVLVASKFVRKYTEMYRIDL